MEKKTSKQQAREMRNEIDELIAKGDRSMLEEGREVVEWISDLSTKLLEAVGDMCPSYPDGAKGIGEAILVGIAQFTARTLEGMQEKFGVKGKNIWDAYMIAILPTARKIVREELKDEKESERLAGEVIEALGNPSITIEQVFDRYLSGRENEKQEIMEHLQEARDLILNMEKNGKK